LTTGSTTKVVVWGEGRKGKEGDRGRKEKRRAWGYGCASPPLAAADDEGGGGGRRRKPRRGPGVRESGALESPSGESDARETSSMMIGQCF
jgi:hypothetical protein